MEATSATTSADPVTLDVSDGVGTVTLSRPHALNSLTSQSLAALLDTLSSVADDPVVRCVVLTGAGRAFCVGQDLREHADNLARQPNDEVWSIVGSYYSPIARLLTTMPKPVIAAVNGIAAGAGASLALACDLRIVAESAGFNLAFAGVGLSCDTGASWTLPRLVGFAKAKELLLMPRTVDAHEALALGLATSVEPSASLADEVAKRARQLAAGPTVAYDAIRRTLAFSASHSLEESLDFEAQMMTLTGATQDHRDSVTAFLAKQSPHFSGR